MVNLTINMKQFIRDQVGKYPVLFYPVYVSWRKSLHRLSVFSSTDIVIEGYMSSANTFSVLAFESSNKVKIAHHFHVIAQVKKGIKFSIPIIVLVRNPIDMVSSLISRNPQINGTILLGGWINFYRDVMKCSQNVLLARFETVTSNFNVVIEAVNKKFNTSFNKMSEKTTTETIFTKMDNFIESRETGALPNQKREILKKQIKEKIRQNKKANEAKAVYEKLLDVMDYV